MNNSIFRSLFFTLLCLTLFSPVALAEKTSQENNIAKEAAAILNKLSAVRPDLSFKMLGKSSMPGVYEVQIESGPVLFVAADGSHFIDGSLYQVTPTQFIDVREVRMSALRRQIFSTIDTDDFIVFKAVGETKAIINVFTDIDCGYCRKLHREVPALNEMGVEVRYLAYPRAGVDSQSYKKIATAWCADDPNASLTNFKNGRGGNISVCDDNPVAEQYALGSSIGVNATPATVLMDGTLLFGYRTADDFSQLLGLKNPAN